jgi:hypothetical protein
LSAACAAQDTILRRNRLSDSVIEKFYVLKANPEIKQGPYYAFFQRQTPVAVGHYKNGKKTGIWQFFSNKGRLVEKYNYDTRTFTSEKPLIQSDDLNFLFDDSLKTTDVLTRPLKVGGSYYGFVPYLNLFKLPFDTFEINTDTFLAYVELVVSPLGRLADYKVHILSDSYQYYKDFSFDVRLFSEEDRTFEPATLNGKPILSRIIIKCYVNYLGGIDFF